MGRLAKTGSLSDDSICNMIKEKLKDTSFSITSHSIDDDGHILQGMLVLMYVKDCNVKICFHVSIRADVAFRVVERIRSISGIRNVDVVNVFYYDNNKSLLYYGDEAEEKLLADLKTASVNEFIYDQMELVMLKNMKSTYLS